MSEWWNVRFSDDHFGEFLEVLLWTCMPTSTSSIIIWCMLFGAAKGSQHLGCHPSLRSRNSLGTPRHTLLPSTTRERTPSTRGQERVPDMYFPQVHLHASLWIWVWESPMQSGLIKRNGILFIHHCCCLRRYWCFSRKTCWMASWAWP